MDITQLLSFCKDNDASDLHLSAGNPPILRVYGDLKRVKANPLSSDEIRTIIYAVMSEGQRKRFEDEKEIDFAVSYGEKARFRINAFTNRKGVAAVIRLIPYEIPSFDDLDLPPVFERLASLEKGLVLVTGPSGCGKSTTLATILNHINTNLNKHIITIEDPVEFLHESKRSLINHRELGSDTLSYDKALRSVMREDPNVILVGEMRDYETMALALTAAETGHLVISTLHSSSSVKAISRIIDSFPPQDKEMVRAMLASSLEGVVSQVLLKQKDGGGRVAAFEVMIGTQAVRNMIRENRIPQLQTAIETGSRYGMITMEESVKDLVLHQVVSEEEAKAGLASVLYTDRDKAAVLKEVYS